jgi:hypothetical protein
MSTPSPDKAATQDCNYQNMWTPGIANSWIRFDLQSAVSLKEMYLWQYNQNYQPGTCCIKTCDIWLSTTGNGTHTSNPSEWTQYNPGNFPWPLTVSGANGDHTVVDMDNINMTARYVMFDNLTNNWGDLTGLSEILFYKTGTGGNVNLPNTHIAATSSSTLDLAAGTENHTLGNFTVSAGAELDVVGVNSLTIGTLTIGINGDNYGKLDLGTQGLTLTGLAVTSVSPTVKECPVAVAAAGSFSTLHATQVTDNGGRKWNVQVREANGVTVNVNGPQLWLVAVPGGTVIMFK